MRREIQSQEQKLSTALVDEAGGYVRRMVEREARGWGDQTHAQTRLESRYGIPFWALERLRTGRAKTVDAGLFARIRGAYLDLCERQVAKLQHEIAVEKALTDDDTLEDLESEAFRLAQKITAKRTQRMSGRS